MDVATCTINYTKDMYLRHRLSKGTTILRCSTKMVVSFSDSVAGHDWRDSTTVIDSFQPVVLDKNFSLRGLHVGIPKVMSVECGQ